MMYLIVKLKQLLILAGDLAVFYLALFLMLVMRYRVLTPDIVRDHVFPFTIVLLFWEVIFYIGGLYNLHELKNTIATAKRGLITLLFGTLLAALFFYFLPFFSIAPKRSLLLFMIFFGLLFTLWRTVANRFLLRKIGVRRAMLLDTSPLAKEIQDYLSKNLQLGYTLIESPMKKEITTAQAPTELLAREKPDVFVLSSQLRRDTIASRIMYAMVLGGRDVIDLATFYETIFGKVPLTEINELWFLEHLKRGYSMYARIIRPAEFILALLLFIALLSVMIIIALLVRLTSRGPILYRQTRVGQNGKPFTLYKFRTMRRDAEASGPQWATFPDARATRIGRVLRYSHLDEFPQLWNILRGQLAFVGPRPERPEFAEKLKKEIPYYSIRTIIKPGLTGWAQINYRYGEGTEDVREKLAYDIFYLKNRSFVLDCLIILRTIRRIFARAA